MISTSNLNNLPDRQTVQSICKAVSVLDAILSQEWEYRYFSYNCKWAENEEFCEIRNGQGDHVLILFKEEGCVINGLAHEYPLQDKTHLTQGLPETYHEFIFGEPVASIGTTFCVWTATNGQWTHGVTDLNDGSEDFLWIFDGDPNTYIEWAQAYYEDDFIVTEETIDIVSKIYEGQPLTDEMVMALVGDLEDWELLKSDLQEINYPHVLTR